MRKLHTVTQAVKMTKHSFLYFHNRTIQLEIQLLKQLQKPIAIHGVTIKDLMSSYHSSSSISLQSLMKIT